MQRSARFGVATASGLARGSLGACCHLQIESVERFSGEIDHVRTELDQVGEGHEVFLVSQTEAEVERLAELLRTTQLAAAGRLHFPLGMLRQGFRLARDRVIVITSGELFHRGELRRLPRRRLGKAIDSFLDLREGDLVVHLAHGIGRYRGMQLLDKDGRVEEHLQIEFARRHEDLRARHARSIWCRSTSAGRKTRPALAKIGGKTWVRQKQAAEVGRDRSGRRDAGDAGRAAGAARHRLRRRQRLAARVRRLVSLPGDARPAAGDRGDQKDMQRPRPMDRLLCGDVGFGKTEVAMRAAFKAVDNGYQVAVLVPTTMLAEQHFHTFRERMAEFPFDIARLSRFCSPREQREIIQAPGRRADRHRDRHASAGVAGRAVLQPGPGDHRRRAAVRRRGQGAAEGAPRDRRRADADGHADPAHAAHVAGRRARHLEPGDAAGGSRWRSKRG